MKRRLGTLRRKRDFLLECRSSLRKHSSGCVSDIADGWNGAWIGARFSSLHSLRSACCRWFSSHRGWGATSSLLSMPDSLSCICGHARGPELRKQQEFPAWCRNRSGKKFPPTRLPALSTTLDCRIEIGRAHV